MNNLDYLRIKKAEAQAIIDSYEDSDSITARSLKYTAKQIQKQLDEEEAKPRSSQAQLDILFDGPSVFGTQGVDASLAGAALSSLMSIIEDQRPEDQPTDTPEGRMYIEGTRSGSFGFALREMSQQPSLFPTHLSEQVSAAVHLMTAVSSANEDFLSALADVSPKSIDGIKKFFASLKANSATCKLSIGTMSQTLDDAAVNRAYTRLQSTEQRPDPLEIQCHFYGLTILSGRFDIVTAEGKISGQINRSIPQSERERLNIDWTGKRCLADLTKITTTASSGSQRVRYVLNKIYPLRAP